MLNVSGVNFSTGGKSNFANKPALNSQITFKGGIDRNVVQLISENPSNEEIIKALGNYAKRTKNIFFGYKKKIASLITGAANKPLAAKNLNYLLSNESITPDIMAEVLKQSKNTVLDQHNAYKYISNASRYLHEICDSVLSCMVQKS